MIRTFLGIDPGKTTGLARIDVDVEAKKIIYQHDSEAGWEYFAVWLNSIETMASERKDNDQITVVMEDYRLFSHKAKDQIGSRIEAAQVIGAVKYAVGRSKNKMVLVLQPSSLNPTAAKWSGRGIKEATNPKLHIPNNISAFNHAHYYIVDKGFIRHRVLDG